MGVVTVVVPLKVASQTHFAGGGRLYFGSNAKIVALFALLPVLFPNAGQTAESPVNVCVDPEIVAVAEQVCGPVPSGGAVPVVFA